MADWAIDPSPLRAAAERLAAGALCPALGVLLSPVLASAATAFSAVSAVSAVSDSLRLCGAARVRSCVHARSKAASICSSPGGSRR